MSLAVLVVVLYPQMGVAQNSIDLSPPGQDVVLAGEAQVDLGIDFGDPALGGGVVIDFDPSALAFLGFDFDPGFPDDPALRLVCPSAAAPCSDFSGSGVLVAFAVDGLSPTEIQGAHTVGTLRFDTLAFGKTTLTTAEDDSVAGPIVGTGSFASPSLGTAEVLIGNGLAAPALSPAALYALCGLLAAGGARRLGVRRSARAGPDTPG